MSFGSWGSREAADRWRGSSIFIERMKACRALCERFEPCDATLVALVS
jgi:hypothetical protein